MVRLTLIVGIPLLLVLAGCSGGSQPPSSTAAPMLGPCTLIGCQSGVTIELTEPLAEGRYEIEVCIEAYCGANTVTLSGNSVTFGSGSGELWASSGGDRISLWSNTVDSLGWSEGAQEVSLSITYLESGTVVDSLTWSDVEFGATQPNGPDCPPLCFQARLIA